MSRTKEQGDAAVLCHHSCDTGHLGLGVEGMELRVGGLSFRVSSLGFRVGG